MIGPVSTEIPWDKSGVGFPPLSVSYTHLKFPDRFLSCNAVLFVTSQVQRAVKFVLILEKE